MFTSKLSLENFHITAANYLQAVNQSISNSAGIIYLAIKENKKIAFITVTSSIAYSVLSYYEIISQHKLHKDWFAYKSIFSIFASADNTCSVPPLYFGNQNKVCSSNHAELFNSLSEGMNAAAKYIGLTFSKSLLINICHRGLSFALCSALIKKWLENNNNQLGLKMIDNVTSMQTREIIYDYSDNVVSGVIQRVSSVIDILVALAKVYDIYEIGKELAEGRDISFFGSENDEGSFSLLNFTVVAVGTFLITNILLNIILKKSTDSVLKKESLFKNNITFNMDNALQVECNHATKHELTILESLFANLTKANVTANILSIIIFTVSMMFTNFLQFVLLWFSMPMLIKNPSFYFLIERLGEAITKLCLNLWMIFNTISSSSTLSYSSTKVKQFIDLIDTYQGLLANRKNFKITVDPDANLACSLTIKYPENPMDSHFPYKVLLKNFNQEFSAGKVYAIVGPSGSGKTSFFNALVGINPYATGQVTITTQENIIYVPQKPVFKQNLSWEETILYPLSVEEYGFNYELEKNIVEWINILGLASVYNKAKISPGWVNNLSGGEAQRVALLQALAKTFLCRKKSTDNILLLLDEAIGALDPEMQNIALGLIREHSKLYRLTILTKQLSKHVMKRGASLILKT